MAGDRVTATGRGNEQLCVDNSTLVMPVLSLELRSMVHTAQ